MTTLAEQLAAQVDGRPGWTFDGSVATFRPPGTVGVEVRVRPIARLDPKPRHHYVAALVRQGRVTHTAPAWDAPEAVRWAERTR